MQPPPPTADLEGRLIANSVLTRMFGGDERPTRIGSYVIIRRIGGGAMGDVFLAHHETLDRKAAIKLVRPAAEDSTIERQRLLREGTVLARIKHPNVVEIYDAGTHDNRVYLAMQYVAGTTLGTWQKAKPWRAVLAAYVEAGRGLQAVHAVDVDAIDGKPGPAPRRNLCHRDFKPDNVLIDERGEVRVADFGLAVPTQRHEPGPDGKLRPLDLRLTADASVVGTPLYLAPEQLSGSPGDARSDQYSFCVALYEALYDQHPFYAPPPATRASEVPTDSGGPGRTHPQFALFEAILAAPLRPPPRTSKLPRRLYTLLARGLQRNPADRYPSMAELLAALEHDPKRRPLQVLAAGLAVGVAFGIGLAANRLPAMCSNVEQQTAPLWNEARQAQVQAAFTATGASHAQTSFAAVDTAARNYLKRWTATRQAACDATYRDGDQLPAQFERSMACLSQQLEVTRNVLTSLASVDAHTIIDARDRIEALPRPEECDARHLYARGCNLESATDPAVIRVRPLIQAAQDAETGGHYVDAERHAHAAAAAARAEGMPSLIVDAEFTLGRILTELGRPEAAKAALITARTTAQAASCETATVDIDAYITKLVALSPTLDVGFGEYAVQVGLSSLDRPGQEDPFREAQLRNDRGLLHEHRHQNFAAAEADYRAAFSLRQSLGLDNTTAQARTQQNLGNLLHRAQRHEEAIDALNTALALHTAAYGVDHPALWRPLFNLGTTHHDAGQFDAAQAALRRSLALATAALGEQSPHVRDIHHALAKTAYTLRDGKVAEHEALAGLVGCEDRPQDATCLDLKLQLAFARTAQGDHEGALKLREEVFNVASRYSSHTDLLDLHIDLAQSLVACGHWGPALDHLRTVQRGFGDEIDDQRRIEATYQIGEALLGLRRTSEATEVFKDLQTRTDDEGYAAVAAWGLARAACPSGRPSQLAKQYAQSARDAFASDLADSSTAQIVADIDDFLASPNCLSNPER